MEIIRIPAIMQDTCKRHLFKGKNIGFVPTMGALHDGHLSLIKRAKMENEITVVSIFVNPAQFGQSEDLEKYPRDIEGDTIKLREREVDILFLPDGRHMYTDGFSTYIHVGEISEKLCGRFRPGHFSGVATVVTKLFNIVNPTRAYFGRKDFQQTVVIKRMARDLNFGIEIVVCPTIREYDGLAMSSRNKYLSDKERTAATVLFKCLSAASDAIKSGVSSGRQIRVLMEGILSKEPLIAKVDYSSVYDPETLDEIDEIKGDVLLAVAVLLGNTRLIDNIPVNL